MFFNPIAHYLLPIANFYPIIIPAIVADNNEAKLPPITAFNPNSDNVFLWFGANDPIPPI